jgi:TetR/AcrR family transcriptional regulator, lmrAB and yxaGH operons repressor
MARTQSIDNEELIARLSCVFREVGYEGASLTQLSKATGLKKASLYHRFPNGKQQMAEEVLGAALTWVEAHILKPLRSTAPPRERVAAVVDNLDAFYESGRQACLLNMLSSPRAEPGPFADSIKGAFEALVAAFSAAARDAGHEAKAARLRAERTIMLLQGSLVMCRGLGSVRPFKTFLGGLADDLLGEPVTTPLRVRA